MRYEMHLNKLPFKQIEKGEKTLEIRLNDSKRKLMNVGDEILFTNRSNEKETLLKTIKELRIYSTFAEMANNEDCVKAGFDKGYSTQDVADCYYQFYSKQDEQNLGVVVIELD